MGYSPGQQDGTQKFGFTAGKATIDGTNYIVESYSESITANRVDIDDGNGKPIGSQIVPQRIEVSLGVQFGENVDSDTPKIGDTISYDSNLIAITGVEVTEAQEDYVRLSISGFVMKESSLTPLTDIS